MQHTVYDNYITNVSTGTHSTACRNLFVVSADVWTQDYYVHRAIMMTSEQNSEAALT